MRNWTTEESLLGAVTDEAIALRCRWYSGYISQSQSDRESRMLSQTQLPAASETAPRQTWLVSDPPLLRSASPPASLLAGKLPPQRANGQDRYSQAVRRYAI